MLPVLSCACACARACAIVRVTRAFVCKPYVCMHVCVCVCMCVCVCADRLGS